MRPRSLPFPLAVLAALLLAAGPAPAAEPAAPVGYVKTVEGAASVLSAGTETAAQPGQPVFTGDTLKTAPEGSLGVTFKDDSVITLGGDTELVVDRFLYDPRAGELGFKASMSKGRAQFLSGVIAKLAPEQVAVATPDALIGVRGTRFLVKVGN
ncbi:FecR family protein [Roseospirillum parvum]|uniref:FecR protein n=1 Tax=Roseospirillum parvum TaxID=83401 RepID=A0A1G7ZGN4_9PROT|nr:FecR family protein [Roseospirillum parvum]SDH07260.1 FecR protein [Roseospirillum parvum]